jgi:hypothetical protein
MAEIGAKATVFLVFRSGATYLMMTHPTRSAGLPLSAGPMRTCGRTAIGNRLDTTTREDIMIVRRRTWFYRLAGQRFAHVITFENPITAAKVKEALVRTIGMPVELWGRST